jgi:uronate dehydrogenase
VQRLLITGAGGTIGSVLRSGLRGTAEVIRLMDLRLLEAEPGEEVVVGDVRSLEDARRAVDGCDAVVHLAGIAQEAEFEAILETNIRGTYSVFEAARLEGCRRIVFASSNHAVGYYPVEEVIGTDTLPRPDSYYGLSKAFGEGLGSLYHDRDGVEVVCLRIGSFLAQPTAPRHLWTWLSHRDGVQLARRSLETPEVGFLVVFGVSNNRRSWWRRDGWDRIGYQPEDDAEAFAGQVGDQQPYRFHGGEFASG